MFYVYILKSLKRGRLYIGQTNNLSNRFLRHNQGLCKATQNYRPYVLIGAEKYLTRSLALKREKYLKSLKSPREVIKIFISSSR